MTQPNHSPKRSPMGAVKDHLNRNSSPLSSLVQNSPRRSNKAVSLGSLKADRKRRAASVSSVSSVSSIEELSDDANGSEEDADDEDDQPAVRAPSYGRRDRPHKAGVKTTKGSKKRRMDGYDGQSDDNGSFDSSDDIYAAVDYISDGDDDEDQDVELLEERMIMESEDEHDLGGILSTPNLVSSGAGESHGWSGSNVFDDHMLLADASFFDDEQLYGAMQTFGETDMASETAVETPMPRRVHFEEDSDSSSDSDSHTDDEIPGDFLQQDSLDPQLRRMIESDNEPYRRHRRQSDEMFAESDYGHSNIYHVESDARSEASESSGYESMQDRLDSFSCFNADPFPKPMMVRLQMKTSLRLPRSPIRVPSSAATLLPPWPRPRRKRASRLLGDEVLLWERLSRIPTNQWLWWIAQVNIW